MVINPGLVLIVLRATQPSVRFLKLPKTLGPEKLFYCAGVLPTEIKYSFLLKAKQYSFKSNHFALVCELKTWPPVERDRISKIASGPKSLREF